MTITPRNAYNFKRAEEYGSHVRLTGKAAVGLERLKLAYGMATRMKVIEYLIEQGVKGLEAAVEPVEFETEFQRDMRHVEHEVDASVIPETIYDPRGRERV